MPRTQKDICRGEGGRCKTGILGIFKRIRSTISCAFSGLNNRNLRRKVGAWGERIAADHLTSSGAIIVARNWRNRRCEVDLVALQGRTLIIVEVKTRKERFKHIYPGSGSVTPRKADHIRSVARSYKMSSSNLVRRYGVTESRIDLIEVYYTQVFGLLLRKRSLVHSYGYVDMGNAFQLASDESRGSLMRSVSP